MNYPTTAAERQRMRDAARRALLDKAEVDAAKYGRSISCGNWPAPALPRHASDPDGCRNDGTGCLCPCHDPKPEEVAP